MLSNGQFESSGLRIPRYLARPAGIDGPLPGLIICHSFPFASFDARQSAVTFPELIDRIANEVGFAAMSFTFRGCGESEGDFSLQGWVDDLRAAIEHLIDEIVDAEVGLCFGPDTLAEARNRGYTLATPGKRRRHRKPRA